jgi:hypothetical protein
MKKFHKKQLKRKFGVFGIFITLVVAVPALLSYFSNPANFQNTSQDSSDARPETRAVEPNASRYLEDPNVGYGVEFAGIYGQEKSYLARIGAATNQSPEVNKTSHQSYFDRTAKTLEFNGVVSTV